MIDLLIKTFFFFLPAGFANMAPVLFKKLPVLGFPINKKLFGKNKTYRGFIVAIPASIVVLYIESLFNVPNFFDYTIVNIFLLGFLLGFGALAGDLIKSFIKRRFKIKEGKTFFPFDQIDWVVGSYLFTQLVIEVDLLVFLIALVLSIMIHPLVNLLGYWLRLKKNKF